MTRESSYFLLYRRVEVWDIPDFSPFSVILSFYVNELVIFWNIIELGRMNIDDYSKYLLPGWIFK
jgi:hypothetical protein